MCVCGKPPLGILPKYLWDEIRLQEIEKAIEKRLGNANEIPVEWIEERNELIQKLYNKE